MGDHLLPLHTHPVIFHPLVFVCFIQHPKMLSNIGVCLFTSLFISCLPRRIKAAWSCCLFCPYLYSPHLKQPPARRLEVLNECLLSEQI